MRRPAARPEERPDRRRMDPASARPARRPADRPSDRPGTPAKPRSAAPAGPRKTGPRPGGPGQERLQKILAAAGIDSRRACEQIILDGRVQVNGVTVTELGSCANPRRDEITVDLIPIHKEDPVYILMNKPKGYVTTVKDDQGRPTVMALLKGVPGRLYPVGRLDFNSEGLLLMTNDGALAQVLTGPEHEIPKVYLVKVHRNPRPELLKEFQEGFLLSGRRLKPCHIEVAEKGDNPWLKVTLTEGKNQQIRRMFAAVGHPVSKLRRVQFGPLADPLLKPGAWRFLSPQEIAAIKSL
ncbi:pseudouridine synthase [Geothrix limicola]|uniref:Pseudouridine synthase n=1 Tax=Geothrix limicola TaxID=2927978 RepID=A0ABQ5QH73_9BACT|nr:pseudouridine synthase [Geothrix limicola]GLH74197.1 pseudouridine synthase [Geothrix limicola]